MAEVHEIQEQVDTGVWDAERAWSEFEAAHPLPESIRDRLREVRERTTSRREQ